MYIFNLMGMWLSGRKKKVAVVAGVLALGVAGGAAYYMLDTDQKSGPSKIYSEYTLIAIEDDQPILYYYDLKGENASPIQEGVITGNMEAYDFEALTIAPDGSVFIVNNDSTTKLYRIDVSELDGNPNTPVGATFIGDTGISVIDGAKVCSLRFIDGQLYGVGNVSKILYKFNLTYGYAREVTKLKVSGHFRVDGLTQGADGQIYLLRSRSKNSELWKFKNFFKGEIVKVLVIEGSRKAEAISSHIDGFIYVSDDERLFKIDPKTYNITVDKVHGYDIEGMDFWKVN
ncbi:MAG: hypothetical protein HRT90_10165 [Candidatus Margulisbacteria bacterium]|nr:hypothetical protein [Candidatus Margulisiibacteriota bacterium]